VTGQRSNQLHYVPTRQINEARFLNRHREAPFLSERISFLKYLQEQGTSRTALRNVSGSCCYVVCLSASHKGVIKVIQSVLITS
jgi:hypothetical protein